MSATVFNNNLKTLGLLQVSKQQTDIINGPAYKEFIKILYLPAGYKLRVDFACYHTQQPTLFFISPNQYLELEVAGEESGYFIFYNRDFTAFKFTIRKLPAMVYCSTTSGTCPK